MVLTPDSYQRQKVAQQSKEIIDEFGALPIAAHLGKFDSISRIKWFMVAIKYRMHESIPRPFLVPMILQVNNFIKTGYLMNPADLAHLVNQNEPPAPCTGDDMISAINTCELMIFTKITNLARQTKVDQKIFLP